MPLVVLILHGVEPPEVYLGRLMEDYKDVCIAIGTGVTTRTRAKQNHFSHIRKLAELGNKDGDLSR